MGFQAGGEACVSLWKCVEECERVQKFVEACGGM